MCGAIPRYGSTSWDGNGSTTRSVDAGVSPSSAPRKNETSAQASSRSPSPGSTYSTTPWGCACAAAATNNALAELVSPDTTRAGTSIPLRVTAVFRTARRLSEVEVATVERRAFFEARQTSSLAGHVDTLTTSGVSGARGLAATADRPADLCVRRKRPRGGAADHPLEIPRLELAGAGPLDPGVLARKGLPFRQRPRRHDTGVGEVDRRLLFRKDGLAAA